MAKEIQFILYNLPDNSGTVQAIVQDETIFLTQKAMAELFGVEVNTINYHLKEIYSSNELTEDSTIRARFLMNGHKTLFTPFTKSQHPAFFYIYIFKP